MCHESANDGKASLSALALDAHNYAGLKWAEWEREYGCEPVTYGTWEVLDGTRVDLTDAFCKCPSWEVWLQVYAGLLTGSWYKPALSFAADPMLYGLHVWQKGWATDPAYLIDVGGWMSRLLESYADTLPATGAVKVTTAQAAQTIPILDVQGRKLTDGWLEGDFTVVRLRPLLEALGLGVLWDESTQAVTVRPGPRGGSVA